MYSTTPMLWVREIRDAELALQLAQQFRICACTETASAEVGSSRRISLGSTASALRIAMRWRWPPENSCG